MEERQCPQCGKRVKEKDKFCIHCGFKLDEQESTASNAGIPGDEEIKPELEKEKAAKSAFQPIEPVRNQTDQVRQTEVGKTLPLSKEPELTDAFAKGLPEWNLEPPSIFVKRKIRKI